MAQAPDDGSAGVIRQQIGEILGTVRSMDNQLRDIKSEAVRQEDRINLAIAGVKTDQSNQQQILGGRLDLLVIQVRELDNKAREITGDVTELREDLAEATEKTHKEIGELKGPVKKLTDFRQHLVAYGLVGSSVFGALVYLWPTIFKLLEAMGRK